jgi:GGDEF domain-containing protein
MSIGVVCCVADDTLDDNILVSRADEMLYQAKERGRNRYVITTDLNAIMVDSIEEKFI